MKNFLFWKLSLAFVFFVSVTCAPSAAENQRTIEQKAEACRKRFALNLSCVPLARRISSLREEIIRKIIEQREYQHHFWYLPDCSHESLEKYGICVFRRYEGELIVTKLKTQTSWHSGNFD